MFKTKIRNITLLSLFAVVSFTTPVAATVVHLHQPIVPRVCTLTVIATEQGSDYAIPEGCGKLTANLPEKQITERGSYINVSPGGSQFAQEFFYDNDRSVFLDTHLLQQPDDGYMLLAREGSVYTFYLQGDDLRGLPRSFEFVAVQDNKVAVQFWPGGRMVWFLFDTPTELDINQDGKLDARFRLINIRDDRTVLLHVTFLDQSNETNGNANQTMRIVATALSTLGVVVLLHEFVKAYVLKHRLPNRDWWVNHPHDPFK